MPEKFNIMSEIIRVIVVDDHRLFRMQMRAAFQYGYPDISIIGDVENGDALLNLPALAEADIVLLDINMPGIGGIETTRILRRDYPNVKILAISGENSAETIQSMLEANINGFISKQQGDTEELAEAIRTVMSGVEYFGRDIAAIMYDIFLSKKKTTVIGNEFTGREKEIITLCRDGLLCKEIADRLNISASTVNTHKRIIFQKLGINSTMEMVQYALKNGIITFFFLFLLNFASCSNFNSSAPAAVIPDSIWSTIGKMKLDSLVQFAATAPQDTNLARLYLKIGYAYKWERGDVDKLKEYYLQSKALSDQLNWNKGRYLFAQYFYEILVNENLIDSAIVVLQETLDLSKKENNERVIASMYKLIGLCYFNKGWYETTLQYYHEAESIYERLNLQDSLADLYGMLAALHNRTKMYHEILTYSGKALEILNDNPDDYSRVRPLINRSLGLINLNELDEAEKCLLEALRLCKVHNTERSLMQIYSNLADIAMHQYDLDKADMYIAKTLELGLKFGNKEAVCFSYANFAYTEMYRGNLQKAQKYAEEAQKIAIEYHFTNRQLGIYELFSVLSSALNDFKKSIFYNQKIDSIENAMMIEKTVTYAKEMEVKYETEKKDLEIKNIITRQKIQRWIYIAGVTVCMVIFFLLWYMLRLRNRRNSTLADMNATKDKFFSIISHDLKNPAVAQRDALKVLAANSSLWDSSTLNEYCTELTKSADGHVELIYNLLDWARVQTGRITCTPALFNLSNRLRTDVSLACAMAGKKGIALNVVFPENLHITADGNIISTVVRNLLTNAIKFTPSGGTVTFAIEPGKRTLFTISDTGIGMSREHVKNLFRIDSQRLREGTAAEQGSGLGLIVCRDLLQKHGSHLFVESEEGKGTRFWFELKA